MVAQSMREEGVRKREKGGSREREREREREKEEERNLTLVTTTSEENIHSNMFVTYPSTNTRISLGHFSSCSSSKTLVFSAN